MVKRSRGPRRKFVVWLHNRVDDRDDEWIVVWARNLLQAEKAEVGFDVQRFYRGDTMSAQEFRRKMGMSA
jgi:hypothetical protein